MFSCCTSIVLQEECKENLDTRIFKERFRVIVVVLVVHVIVGVGGGVGFDCLVIHPRLDHLSSRKFLTLHRSLPSLALSLGKKISKT